MVSTTTTSSRLRFQPLTPPPTADASLVSGFGCQVFGYDPETATEEELAQIQQKLYEHDVLLFKDTEISPEKQYLLTKSFDPESKVSPLLVLS